MRFAQAAVALVFGAALAAAALAAGSDNGAAARLEKLKAEIARLSAAQNDEIAHKHRELGELAKLERSIGTIERDLAQLDARQKQLADRRRTLDGKAAAARTAAVAAQAELARTLQAAFVLGREPEIKLALQGDDPADAARLLGYYGYYARARASRIDALTASINRYAALESDLADTRKQLAATRASRRSSLTELRKTRQARQATVARLTREIADKHDRMASLHRDAERLENVVRSVNRDLADVPAKTLDEADFDKLRGKLPWPTTGRLVSGFGSTRAGTDLTWEAVRIAAPEGTPVRAIAHGRIAYAGWLPYYGLVLIVDHGNGYLTVYGHNQALYKQVGDWVEAGDMIATVGASGGQPSPVLYFQIRHDDRPLDPERWCMHDRPPAR